MGAAPWSDAPMLDIRTAHLRTRDGFRLAVRRYERRGAPGIRTLCLPAPGANGRDFAGLAVRLAAGGTVLCPDPRGCGLSDRDPVVANYGPAVAAADVLDVLGADARAPVLGIADGLAGFALLAAAATCPERFSALVLVDAGPELAAPGIARLVREAAALRPVETTQAAAALLHPGGAPPGTDLRTRVLARFRHDALYRWVPDSDRALRLRLDRWCDTGARRDAAAAARALPARLPLLLIHGAASDVLPAPALGAWRTLRRDLAAFRVPERGHELLLEAPEARRAIEGLRACLR